MLGLVEPDAVPGELDPRQTVVDPRIQVAQGLAMRPGQAARLVRGVLIHGKQPVFGGGRGRPLSQYETETDDERCGQRSANAQEFAPGSR